VRHPSRPARAVTAVAAAAVMTLALPPATATAVTATSVGNRYTDKLDSRWSAQRLAQASAALGYAAGVHTAGRTAGEAWNDGLGAGVFGLFGHANGGLFQLREGSTPAQDAYLVAGTQLDVAPLYSNMRFFTEYLPVTDIDDMRLLVLAGCYTATTSASYGDFNAVAVEKGVDSVVSFPGLVYYPASEAGTASSATAYSGNYFWDRFAAHAQSGVSVSTALSRARTDLVAKEGSAGGWDRYVIRGSVASPGAVSLLPAGSGQALTSRPLGVAAFSSVQDLTVTSRSTAEGPDGPVTDVRTAEGVSYRLQNDGSLLDLTAPAAVTGPVVLDETAARDRAERFLLANLPGFDASWPLLAAEPVSHEDSDELALLRYRPRLAGQAGPQEITVEVDRRTGAVTYLGRTSGSASDATFAVTETEAIDAALGFLGHDAAAARRITATADTWDSSRWTVVVDRGLADGLPDVDLVTIDAVTGAVTGHVTS
jgi:hypothetical protein